MTGRDRLMIGGLAVALVLGALWFAVVGPRRAEVSTLREQIGQARTQRDAAVTLAAKNAAAHRTYAKNFAAVAELGKAVPDSQDTASLLFELQALAGHSHVKLTAVTPTAPAAAPPAPAPAPAPAGGSSKPATPPVPAAAAAPAGTVLPDGVQPQPIALSFEGTYLDLERFLRRVHRLTRTHGNVISVHGRLLAIDAVQLSSDGSPGAPIIASVSATSFTAPVPAAPSATPVPAGSTPSVTASAAPAAPITAMAVGR